MSNDVIHWTTHTGPDRVKVLQEHPSWLDAVRFMDDLVTRLDHAGRPLYREVCYQRLTEGVWPTA